MNTYFNTMPHLKIVTQEELKERLAFFRNANKPVLDSLKIVFTNGCFDLLHRGHVETLTKARDMGALLIVGLNSDESVRRLKGDSRPISNQENRAMVLSAFSCVDYVVIFDEDTPLNLIKAIKPDILVKGGDYKHSDIVGADFVESYGGKVETIPLVQGESTSNLVKRIKG